ncbi:MAG: rhomboid family intramembrane serine protease [Gammaproteobacteria bacterium]|nr:rhomboid family intramembrane serine protease [Gammaproteobacteria bacterium]MDH5650401.1 rhomboid family intramembrane serine protease [Gammaproteobacteria bacterium]
MFFFPYKVDLALNRFPIITVAICLLCIGIFLGQLKSDRRVYEQAGDFCEEIEEATFLLSVEKITGDMLPEYCALILSSLHQHRGRAEYIKYIARNVEPFSGMSKEESQGMIVTAVMQQYEGFRKKTDDSFTVNLMHYPHSMNPVKMITSAFAHGGWEHLLGNLIFFFAFAASVEIVTGVKKFLMLVIGLSLGVGIFYSISMAGGANIPTLGLSGVISGMMGMFAFLMPTLKIRCFLFFFVYIRFFTVSAWILVAAYVGKDIFYMLSSPGYSEINFVAHVSGAVLGFLSGLVFFGPERARVKAEIAHIKDV